MLVSALSSKGPGYVVQIGGLTLRQTPVDLPQKITGKPDSGIQAVATGDCALLPTMASLLPDLGHLLFPIFCAALLSYGLHRPDRATVTSVKEMSFLESASMCLRLSHESKGSSFSAQACGPHPGETSALGLRDTAGDPSLLQSPPPSSSL